MPRSMITVIGMILFQTPEKVTIRGQVWLQCSQVSNTGGGGGIKCTLSPADVVWQKVGMSSHCTCINCEKYQTCTGYRDSQRKNLTRECSRWCNDHWMVTIPVAAVLKRTAMVNLQRNPLKTPGEGGNVQRL